ncbi:MAG: hypothetical protein DMG36_19945 [Acidobacteria bacterium]|nr:MAG: hypothetical protein DMG36_19945 [Acidobacteriota bacterium]
MSVNPGFFRSMRMPKRTSCNSTSSIGNPLHSRTISFVCSTPPSFISRLPPRCPVAHTRSQIVLNVHLEMAFHLCSELPLSPFSPEESAQPEQKSTQPFHNILCCSKP